MSDQRNLTHDSYALHCIDDALTAWQQGDQQLAALYMAEAQARATLALAEQQRIANLIALANSGLSTVAATACRALIQRTPCPDVPGEWITRLQPEVAAALRIEAHQ